MRDLFIEIWESVRRNKLRTCLTGFAVAWGIFMLIALLGSGNGLLNAFNSSSDEVATNVMTAYPSTTSKPYAGYKMGRWSPLYTKQLELTKEFSPHIEDVSPIASVSGVVNYGDRYVGSASGLGVYPNYTQIYSVKILYGRFLNDFDIKENRKVAVIGSNTAKILTDSEDDYSRILGNDIEFDGLSLKVIGIYKADASSSNHELNIPFTTAQSAWTRGGVIDNISFTFKDLSTEEEMKAFEEEYRAAINTSRNVAPDDVSALYIRNRFSQHQQMEKGNNMIRTALWIIGIFTLLSGIVGVSNIMLITVKERTHEFGIRKAIGAGPWSITKLIVTESVAITTFFGYLGMMLGMIVCEILDRTLGQNTVSVLGDQVTVFRDVSVGVDVALGATLLLIVAGTLAGLIPAIKAAKVRPIEALRSE